MTDFLFDSTFLEIRFDSHAEKFVLLNSLQVCNCIHFYFRGIDKSSDSILIEEFSINRPNVNAQVWVYRGSIHGIATFHHVLRSKHQNGARYLGRDFARHDGFAMFKKGILSTK